MKLLIIGDIHSKKANLEVVEEVFKKCRLIATKCDLTIFMGDMNDTKANIRSETIRQFRKYLKDWPTRVNILIGNHDLDNSMNTKGGHSLEFLKEYDNIQLVDKPMGISLSEKQAFMVPYMLNDEFAEIELEDADYLFLHQDLEGAKYSNQTPVKNPIKADQFSKYKRVFVGHIHLPQEFKNIIYVGTPYTESFKESDEQKRVIVFDTDKDKIINIPLGVRQHVTYPYTINSLEEIAGIKADLKTKIKKGQIVRVIITVPEEIESKIKRSLFPEFDISLKVKKVVNTNKTILVTENMTNLETMEIYLKQLDLKPEILARVLDKNKEILGDIK